MRNCAWRVLSLVAAVAVWSSWGEVSHADEQGGPARSEERTARAEAQFREGVEAFASGRYYTAIELFTEADRIHSRPELSFDIARSYENLGEDATAVAFYREYLRRAGHPADEADVLSRIGKLESNDATPGLRPGSDDDGPPIVATQATSGPFSGAGNGSAANGAIHDSEARDSGKVFTTLGWVGLGAAAAAFGGAAAFEVMREDAEDAAAQERQQIRFDHYVQTMEANRTAARVLFGTGAALALTGGIFLFVGASRSQDRDKKSPVALRVSPEPGGLSAGASWRF
jgi:hypothetical protein